ncbi:hypothetical protein A2U01_0083424, partial [Trifolium medium]|nr:hypothetical protein [Trifolium medium]
IANHSMAVFKLLETVTFLNGQECKYLQERDAARKKQKLMVDLEVVEVKLVEVVQERDTLLTT